MEKDVQDGNLYGNLYGMSIEAVKKVTDSGKRCILDIDVQGARSVKASSLEVISIFICPPSFEELEKRLRARGTETEEQVRKRLRNARAELEQGKSSGLFDHILVNDDLETCYGSLKKILALYGSTDACYQPSTKNVEIPAAQWVFEMDQKVLIQCGSMNSEMPQIAVPRTAHSGWPVFAQSDGPYRKLWKRWVSQEIHFQCPRYIDFGGRPSRTFSSSTHWTSSGSFCDVDPSDAGHFNPPKGLIPFPFPFSRSLDARAYKTVQSKMVSWR